MDGGAWWAAVHGVGKTRTRLSDFTFTFHFPALEKEMATRSKCSCLENPRDGGVWWAAVYGVAQSWTWLKWLSSSSLPFHWWEGQRRQKSQAGGILALPCAAWLVASHLTSLSLECKLERMSVTSLPAVLDGWEGLSTVRIQGVFIWSWLLFFKMCLINMWWMNEEYLFWSQDASGSIFNFKLC